MSGWVKLHRSLLEWEWYDDVNATRLLIHLILSVNYEDKRWRGIVVKSGSMVLSWETISSRSGLTKQQARTAMSKLEGCGEVTRKTTNKYQVITLVKWAKMQDQSIQDNKQANRQTTGKQQANNIQITPTKEREEYKEGKNNTIPQFEIFENYAFEKAEALNIKLDQTKLKLKYEAWKEAGWKTGGNKPRQIKNWKSTLLNSINYLKQDETTKDTRTSANEFFSKAQNTLDRIREAE